MLSAFAVGLGGANILSLRRDRSLWQETAVRAAAAPANSVLAALVRDAPTALRALEHAVVAAPRPAAPAAPAPLTGADADRVALVRAAVRRLTDRGRLADLFARLRAAGQPAALRRDANNIDLGVLALAHAPGPALAEALRNLRVGPVAGAPLEALNRGLAAAGVDVAAEQAAVADAWDGARGLKGWLAQAPADWQLAPDQLG
jgi:hypothetical protein